MSWFCSVQVYVKYKAKRHHHILHFKWKTFNNDFFQRFSWQLLLLLLLLLLPLLLFLCSILNNGFYLLSLCPHLLHIYDIFRSHHIDRNYNTPKKENFYKYSTVIESPTQRYIPKTYKFQQNSHEVRSVFIRIRFTDDARRSVFSLSASIIITKIRNIFQTVIIITVPSINAFGLVSMAYLDFKCGCIIFTAISVWMFKYFKFYSLLLDLNGVVSVTIQC